MLHNTGKHTKMSLPEIALQSQQGCGNNAYMQKVLLTLIYHYNQLFQILSDISSISIFKYYNIYSRQRSS